MFWKHYKYRLKTFIRNHSLYFWSMIFPFILATLFYLAFGNYMKGDGELLDPIPVAVVKEEVSPEKENFLELLKQLSSGKDQVLEIKEVSQKKADQLLRENKVDAVILVSDTLAMKVTSSDINQTVIKNIMDTYQRRETAIIQAMTSHPEKAGEILKDMEDSVTYLNTVSLSESTPNPMCQYFYALVAMACLYSCFYGISIASDLQGNLSQLAARRCVAPDRKLSTVFCDYLAAFTLSAAGILLLFIYLVCILDVDFGQKLWVVIATALVGSMFGISFGALLGSASRHSRSLKISFAAGFTLFMAFFAGLMVQTVPYMVEQHIPLLNRINPAMLLANSFYCLTFYDNNAAYMQNMIILIAYTVVCILASGWLIRRKKYASI